MRTHNCLDSGPFGGQVTQESRARLQLPLSRVPHGGIRGTTVVNKDGGGDRHDMAKERVRQLVFLLRLISHLYPSMRQLGVELFFHQ